MHVTLLTCHLFSRVHSAWLLYRAPTPTLTVHDKHGADTVFAVSRYMKYSYVQKRGWYNKAFKTRFVRLIHGDTGQYRLAYYDAPESLKCNGEIELSADVRAESVESTDHIPTFAVHTANRTFTLRANNEVDKLQWIELINKCVRAEDMTPAIPSG